MSIIRVAHASNSHIALLLSTPGRVTVQDGTSTSTMVLPWLHWCALLKTPWSPVGVFRTSRVVVILIRSPQRFLPRVTYVPAPVSSALSHQPCHSQMALFSLKPQTKLDTQPNQPLHILPLQPQKPLLHGPPSLLPQRGSQSILIRHDRMNRPMLMLKLKGTTFSGLRRSSKLGRHFEYGMADARLV